MPVYVLATLDTKGAEARYVCQLLSAAGTRVVLVDAGCLGDPTTAADIDREAVFAAAGTTLAKVQQTGDRSQAIDAAARGAATLAAGWHQAGTLDGIIGIGGSAGSTIGSAAMRALPIGVPKLLVSTLASGQVRHYVGDKDILMLNSVVDIAGLNRISRRVLANAAHAMAGMVSGAGPLATADDKPLVAATMFGVTTPAVDQARHVLEAAGYEVLVFHATGSGGRAMETLIADGLLAGVLDLTTTELADELVGGMLSAGPDRLTAAARAGVPQVVSVGATDMVNFHARSTVPAAFASRKFHQHNASVTLMRTTPEENARIGADIGRKLAAATSPAAVLFPIGGVSAIDAPGQPFDDPLARQALHQALVENLGNVELIDFDCHINDPRFGQAAAAKLIELMRAAQASEPRTPHAAGK